MLAGIKLHDAVEALLQALICADGRHCAYFAARTPANLRAAFSTIRQHKVVPDKAVYTALALMHRLLIKHADVIILTPANAVTTFLTALLVAGKLWLDTPFNTISFAMLAGVSAHTMFEFEAMFINMLDWDVIVTPGEIAAVTHALQSVD